ncbi:MAG: hypothetical protein K2X11_22065 [Acetobacteraceae bacterium]|nr:hypothetical protein [Acetobacteraceae bacterium]
MPEDRRPAEVDSLARDVVREAPSLDRRMVPVSDEAEWAVTQDLLADRRTVPPRATLDAATAGGIAIR